MHNNQILWTSIEAEAVTGGRSTRSWNATGVAINMAELKAGDLFIATQDDDLNAVFKKGAAAAIIATGRRVDCDLPLMEVANVFEALQNLARAARYKTHATILSVQGRENRKHMARYLSCLGAVHKGGRHLSLGLATLPEDIPFGIFGASPAVHPDFAIITNPSNTNRDTLFEMMPAHASVLINTDKGDILPIIARAKAAGIQNIFTYGHDIHADVQIKNCIRAANGTRVYFSILKEDHVFTARGDQDFDEILMAALLVVKLTGGSVSKALRAMEAGQTTAPQLGNIALIDPTQNGQSTPQAVYKVTNMIDLGIGQQTAVLENLANFSAKTLCFPKAELSIPRRVDNLNLMNTSKNQGAVRNAHATLSDTYKGAKLENIATAVLMPGDFVVFNDIRERSKAMFSEALRLIPTYKPKPIKKLDTVHAI